MPAEVPEITFASATYDRIAHRRSDSEWLASAWERPDTRVLVIAGTRLRPEPLWTTIADASAGLRILLGDDGERISFAVLADASVAGPDWVPLRGALPFVGAADASYVVHAVGLAEWHWATRHCPRCGGVLEARQSGHALQCLDCERLQFPRSDPAVIMLVRDADDRVLLGRQRSWPPGRWSTLAGFVEPGESLEMAVRREVAEEAGVLIGRVDYFGSQPWPLPASLMLGFVAHATDTAIEVDGDEIEDARWFSRDEAKAGAEDGTLLIPPGVSISRTLIIDWYGEDLPGSWS